MGLSRQTVRTFLRADVFPERADRRCGVSKLDPFVAYLRARLEAGESNGSALWRELRDRHAFTGSQPLVRKWVTRHRHLIPPTSVKRAPRRGRRRHFQQLHLLRDDAPLANSPGS
jgi:transposase